MKLFGRRKATGLMAAAPLAAGMVGDVSMNRVAEKMAYDGAGLVPTTPFGRIPKPAGLNKYYETVQKANQARDFYNQRRDLQRHRESALSPNITCLRSVSTQHKYIMHMREVDRIIEEHKSFVEKMMDVFGVRDYFKKMESEGLVGSAESLNRY